MTRAPGAAPAALLEKNLLRVSARLRGCYGRPRRRRLRPLDTLVETVLSQNTSDVNSTRAYDALRRAYPSWEHVARARPARLASVIRSGGLARLKSRRIQDLLYRIRAREGRYSLACLNRLPPRAAAARLDSLPGVGPKTRACVLLFACGKHAFPVDTHVHRIAVRLGLVPAGASAKATQALLEPAVPHGRALELHLNLIRLGREVCRARSPRCPVCPIGAWCPSRGRA